MCVCVCVFNVSKICSITRYAVFIEVTIKFNNKFYFY